MYEVFEVVLAWLTVSNAFARSRKMARVISLFSRLCITVFHHKCLTLPMMWNIQSENPTDYLLITSFLFGNFLTDYK